MAGKESVSEDHVQVNCFQLVHDYIIGENQIIKKIKRMIYDCIQMDTDVLVIGETGTGKNLIAKMLHENNHLRGKIPLVSVNCAAIPETLIEDELFGHEKGAYTNAIKTRKGKFEIANGGILFLDEITEMRKELQSKLLHVLEENTFSRLGAEKIIEVDVKIIAATNKDIYAITNEGEFRSDLYYRLKKAVIMVPPLRERKDDIPILINYFLGILNQEKKRDVKISSVAINALFGYYWPGNVRELKNLINSAYTFCKNDFILISDLPDEIVNYEKIKNQPNDKTKTLEDGFYVMHEQKVKALEMGMDLHNKNKELEEELRLERKKHRKEKLQLLKRIEELEIDKMKK